MTESQAKEADPTLWFVDAAATYSDDDEWEPGTEKIKTHFFIVATDAENAKEKAASSIADYMQQYRDKPKFTEPVVEAVPVPMDNLHAAYEGPGIWFGTSSNRVYFSLKQDAQEYGFEIRLVRKKAPAKKKS